MEIGKSPPVAGAAGFYIMTNPIMTVKSFAPEKLHNLTTDKIIFRPLPEDGLKLTQPRFALIGVSDAAGRWQQIVRKIQTLRRRLTIDFHIIYVQSARATLGNRSRDAFLARGLGFQRRNLGIVQSFEFENQNVTCHLFASGTSC